MKLAIQERLLPGHTTLARLENAKAAGFTGVEFSGVGLGKRIPEIVAALESTGLEAAAVNIGGTQLIHPNFGQREEAIVGLRLAMANTLDLGAKGVIFAARTADTPRLPDLHPYKSDIELEAELLVSQLRTTLCDFAYALGAELYLQVSNRQDTHLILSMDRAAIVLEKNGNHPHLKIAANTCDLDLQEEDPAQVLRQHMEHLAYVHLSDSARAMPGMGQIPFGDYIKVLKAHNYQGWMTVAATQPNHDALAKTVEMMKNLVI